MEFFYKEQMNMKKQRCALVSLLFFLLPFYLFSQNTFTIHVKNQQKVDLEYPEIQIPESFFLNTNFNIKVGFKVNL